jgi:hypothetical protein
MLAEIDRVLDGYAGKYDEMMKNIESKYMSKKGQ